jgi:cell division transport system permease protein
MTLFWRILKFSFQDIARNSGLSMMTITILVLMLLSVNTLWSVEIITKEAVKIVKDQVNVSIFFSAGASEKNINEIKKYISAFPEVVSIQTISREEVLALFKERHKLSKEILQALDELGGNPFGPTLTVKTREPEDYKKIISAISVPEYEKLIESKSFDEHENAIEKIQNITTRVEKMGIGLSVFFVCIAFLIIFNTIRVSIQMQWVEISIKRLVGASNWFIRGPYAIESLIFTTISVGLTFAIIFFALRFVDPYFSVVFPNGFTLTNYYNSHILYLVGIQFVAVLALTIVSSSLAMRRQLKV